MVVTGKYGNYGKTLRHKDVACNVSDPGYYHTNHLGSTAFVTDNNATVTQGFLYAPFGEITTEYAPLWQNGLIPNYTFNAKELDEETGMYYYEARYYNPPVFTSRDPLFEKYFWMSPYAYCANNPVKYVDPSGMDVEETDMSLLQKWECLFVDVKNNCLQLFEQDGDVFSMLPDNKLSSQQTKPKPTYEQMISAKLSNLQEGDEISGKELANLLGIPQISSAIENITKSIDNTFKINRTLVGKTVLNDSPMKIEKTSIMISGKKEPAYRIQIDYKKVPVSLGALNDFYIHGNNIYYYGQNGNLCKGSFPSE